MQNYKRYVLPAQRLPAAGKYYGKKFRIGIVNPDFSKINYAILTNFLTQKSPAKSKSASHKAS
ncbi:hypothetical protein D3Z36_14030 [Lachnospiraceae bacterium]|nr:hypothetical protein [Lachnospiraceae bacterium]